MLESLTIKRFRGHRERVMQRLARVNLLVGLNNAGKTAVLDAVELLARDGHPRTFASLAGRRSGEYASAFDYREGDSLPPAVRYLFHGYGDAGKASFELTSEGTPARTLTISWEDRSEDGAYPGAAEIHISRGGAHEERLGVGSVSTPEQSAPHRSPQRVQFVSPLGAIAGSLRPLWETIVGNPEEDQVLAAMQILDDRLDRIVFSTERDAASTIFIRLKGSRERVPLSTLGDGMRRMLGIAIRAVKAQSGWLLLDEVDSGLHFSAMQRLWHWLITYAAISNTQIFATPPSWLQHGTLRTSCRWLPSTRWRCGHERTSPQRPEPLARRRGRRRQVRHDHCANGIDPLRDIVALEAKSRHRLGMVFDADLEAGNAWSKVRQRLQKIDTPPEWLSPMLNDLPLALPKEGLMIERGERALGAWVMPDNGAQGALEDFLVDLVPSGDVHWQHACESVTAAMVRGVGFPTQYRAKANIHTWLAWQKDPGVPFGRALKCAYCLHDSAVAMAFVTWFRRMFPPGDERRS